MSATTSYPKAKIKILLLEGIHPAAVKLFKQNGYDNIEVLSGALSEKELIQRIADVHVLGIRSKTQLTPFIFEHTKRLLAVGCYCIGTNQVNINSANEHGVAIFNSPFSNTRSVAELVIANCIMLLRKIQAKNAAAHNGIWLKDSSECYEVRGKTLGLIGYGHIGTQVSILAEAMGMNVIFYDIESKLSLGNARASKNLNALLREAHIVSLHVPATASTRNMVNESFLKKMRKGAALINLSRGDVMDVRAVRKAVKQNMLAGVAVDVFPSEPENKGDVFKSPLQHLPNVILTPHIGGSTEEAQENIGIDVASKVIRFINTGSSVGSVSIPPLSLPVQNKSHRILHIHHNVPGVLSEINAVMVSYKANILGQYLQTNNQVGYVAIDIDKKTISAIIEDLKKVKETIRVRNLY